MIYVFFYHLNIIHIFHIEYLLITWFIITYLYVYIYFDIFFIYMHIINARSHTSHCFWLPPVQRLCFPGAIFEFFDGLPDMHVLIPKWVMEDLAIDERLWCDKGYPVELLMHQMVFFKLTVHGKPSTNAHGSKILIEGNVSHPKTSDWRIPFLRTLPKS